MSLNDDVDVDSASPRVGVIIQDRISGRLVRYWCETLRVPNEHYVFDIPSCQRYRRFESDLSEREYTEIEVLAWRAVKNDY